MRYQPLSRTAPYNLYVVRNPSAENSRVSACTTNGHAESEYEANADAQKSATQLSNTRTAAPRHAQRSTAQVAHGASTAETDVPPSAAALADAPKLPDVPASFAPAPQATLAQSSRLADATGPVPAPATNDTEEPQSLVNAQTSQAATAAQAADERPSSLIVVSLVLLTLVGPVFHAARWLRRRRASDRRGLGQVDPVTVLPRTPVIMRPPSANNLKPTSKTGFG